MILQQIVEMLRRDWRKALKDMEAIQRVRDLHQPIQTSGALGSVTHCSHCTRLIGENPKIYMAFHPCETIKALDNKQHED